MGEQVNGWMTDGWVDIYRFNGEDICLISLNVITNSICHLVSFRWQNEHCITGTTNTS
jgi:hypothetical protein